MLSTLRLGVNDAWPEGTEHHVAQRLAHSYAHSPQFVSFVLHPRFTTMNPWFLSVVKRVEVHLICTPGFLR